MTTDTRKARLPVVLLIALAFLLIQDTLVTQFGVQGEVTVAVAALLVVVGLATFGSDRTAISSHAVPIPMQLFIVWAVFRFAMEPSIIGLQNLLVWFIFPATIGVVYARSQRGTFERAYPLWKWFAVAAALIYLVQFSVGSGFPYSPRGAGWLPLLALVLIVPMTAARKSSLIPVVLLVAVIGLSLSRTPIAIAAVLLVTVFVLRPFRGQKPHPGRVAARTLVALAGAGGALFLLVTRVTAIRERFTVGDGYSVGGVSINSSGRDVLWSITIQHWQEAPWLGHGPGSAQTLITSRFPGWIAHPHNEYLRLLDDTGVVGLTLWGLGMLLLLSRAARDVLRATDQSQRALHLGAFLATLVLLLGAITDNVTIGIFCAMITGSVIGLSTQARMSARDDFEVPSQTPSVYKRIQRNQAALERRNG